MSSHLVDWTPEQYQSVEEEIFTAKHSLHTSGLFDDEALIELFDTHPIEDFGFNTMSYSNDQFEWREGIRNGVSSEVLLELLYRGHLWINLRNVVDHHPKIAAAVHGMYDEMEANKPGFTAVNRSANLLISSPKALVYYHIDIPVNMLWHIRGEKRAWVYPPFDTKFSPQTVVENICAATATEDAPYDISFDEDSQIFDVEPGQLLTWPQMTPHRVENTGTSLQVSLSTEHKNPRAVRRINVHLANKFLRETFGLPCNSFDPEGFTAHAKQAMIRGVRKWRQITGTEKERKIDYAPSFQLDPASPTGLTLFEDAAAALSPEEQIAVA